MYRFIGTYKAIHGIYLYGLKFVGFLILLFCLYRWTFGNGHFTHDIALIILERDSLITACIVIITLYGSILFIVGRNRIFLDSKQVTLRFGRWISKLLSYSELESIRYVQLAVKGHEMPSIGLETKSGQFFYINIISFEKDIQVILDLLVANTGLTLDSELEALRTSDSVGNWIKDKQNMYS